MRYFVIGMTVVFCYAVVWQNRTAREAYLQSSKYDKSHRVMWYKEYMGLAKKSKKYAAKGNRKKTKRYAKKAAKVMDRMTPIVL